MLLDVHCSMLARLCCIHSRCTLFCLSLSLKWHIKCYNLQNCHLIVLCTVKAPYSILSSAHSFLIVHVKSSKFYHAYRRMGRSASWSILRNKNCAKDIRYTVKRETGGVHNVYFCAFDRFHAVIIPQGVSYLKA